LFAWITVLGFLAIVLVTLVRGRTHQDAH